MRSSIGVTISYEDDLMLFTSGPMRERFSYGFRPDWQMAKAYAVAAKIAFPIAGATAVVAGSPSPTGASVLGRNSTSTSGTSPMRSERIGVEVRILRLAVHELRSLVQGHAQSPQRRALHLRLGAVRMNDRTGVNDQRQLLDGDVAAGAVDPHASSTGDPGGHVAFLAERRGDAEPDIIGHWLTPADFLCATRASTAACRCAPPTAFGADPALRPAPSSMRNRNATGSTPAHVAASSMKLSRAQLIQPAPTERS